MHRAHADLERLARACRALLATVGLGNVWTSAGPTQAAVRLLEDEEATRALTGAEHTMLLAAWALWAGDGQCSLAAVLRELDGEPLAALCALVVAVNRSPCTGAIDTWLFLHDHPDS